MRNYKISNQFAGKKHGDPGFGILTTVRRLADYDYIYVFHKMHSRDILQLVHETDNPLNPHAVAVYYRDFKIGYLSEKSDRMVANLMTRFENLTAYVKHNLNNSLRPFEDLDIEIRTEPFPLRKINPKDEFHPGESFL